MVHISSIHRKKKLYSNSTDIEVADRQLSGSAGEEDDQSSKQGDLSMMQCVLIEPQGQRLFLCCWPCHDNAKTNVFSTLHCTMLTWIMFLSNLSCLKKNRIDCFEKCFFLSSFLLQTLHKHVPLVQLTSYSLLSSLWKYFCLFRKFLSLYLLKWNI